MDKRESGSIDARHNTRGQLLGEKGRRTRQILLDTVSNLLPEFALRELGVALIAKEAQISPTTFYIYFPDVESVVYELVQRCTSESKSLCKMVQDDWPDEEVVQKSNEFAAAYFDFWDAHFPELQIRNLSADQGDRRFHEERVKSVMPIVHALAKKIEQGRFFQNAKEFKHKEAMSSLILAGMERNASAYRGYRGRYEITRDSLIESSAYLIATVIQR